MITYKEALKRAAIGSLKGLVWRETWTDLLFGVAAALLLCSRVVTVLTYPISTPLIAWVLMRETNRREAKATEIRRRMRADMHKNGRTKC